MKYSKKDLFFVQILCNEATTGKIMIPIECIRFLFEAGHRPDGVKVDAIGNLNVSELLDFVAAANEAYANDAFIEIKDSNRIDKVGPYLIKLATNRGGLLGKLLEWREKH